MTTTTNQAPVACNITISGTAQVGETLTGIYSYSNAENDPEGTSIIRWYRGEQADSSDKTEIPGIKSTSYPPAEDDLNKYVFFEVQA